MSWLNPYNALACQYDAETEKPRSEFLADCKLAKAVKARTCVALLVGDQVITMDCSDEKVEWLAAALRASAEVPA